MDSLPDYRPGQDRFIPLEDLSYATGELFELHAAVFSWRAEIQSRIHDVLHHPSPFNVRLERIWTFPDGATYMGPYFVFSHELEDVGVMDLRMFIDPHARNHMVIHTLQGVPMGGDKLHALKNEIGNPLEAMATYAVGSMTARIREGAGVYLLESKYQGARIEGIRDRFFQATSQRIAPNGLLKLNGVRSFRGGGGYDSFALSSNRKRVQKLLDNDTTSDHD